MPYFHGARGRVYYRAWPAPDSLAGLVFLHGFGEHSGLYHRFAAAVNARGIDLWALDEIGHGLSDGERGVVRSLDHLVADGQRLTAIARGRRPGRPLVMAGHSLGGMAAALSVIRYPDAYAGAVFSGTPLSPPRWVLNLPTAADGANAAVADVSLNPANRSADPAYREALETDPLAFTSAYAAGALRAASRPAWAELASGLADLDLPTLLVHGGADPIVPLPDVRGWATRIRDARLASFRGARHDLLNEKMHARVAATVADFVRAVVTADTRVRAARSQYP